MDAQRHPDHASEQAYIVRAHHEFGRSVVEIEAALRRAIETPNNPDAAALAANLTHRLRQLAAAGLHAPCFARLDDEDGERLYIGRQHIADADHTPLVIDWRAPRAAAFYRATPLDPMGVVLRRQFMLDELDLVEIHDADLTDPEAAVGVPDPLLAEINRARTGRMREVVSTIQVEQDLIVRAPRDRPLFVQGGPGTGKTVVGLHRAAYLLYEHRDILSKDGVLVLGPNERFIDYISDVLPQLGERTVRQSTLHRLLDTRRRFDDAGRARNRDFDRLRTDHRMVGLIDRALRSQPVPPREDLRVRGKFGGSTITAETAARLMGDALAENQPVGLARQHWVAGVVRELFKGLPNRDLTAVSAYAAEVRRSDDFKRYVDRAWKTPTEVATFALIWRTVKQRPELARDAGFSEADIAVLAQGARSKPADALDLVVLDEIRAALGKRPTTFGHVILDEAQDLSPLELRAVGRRVHKGSITVLGDLAQSTGLHTYRSWDQAADLMAVDGFDPASTQLSVGYRVPAEFMEVANQLLPMMGVDLPPTGFIRVAGRPGEWRTVASGDVATATVELANRLDEGVATVAVIGPRQLLDTLAGLADGVSALTPAESKGLEFEAVVLMEPAHILAERPAGMNQLFVALTRSLQELYVVASDALPDAMMAGFAST